MEVEKVICGTLALVDLQAETGVERFLTRSAYPEVALAGLAHLDHPLFHGAGANHDAVDLQATLRRQELLPALDLGWQDGHAVVPRHFGLAWHARPPFGEPRSLGTRPAATSPVSAQERETNVHSQP